MIKLWQIQPEDKGRQIKLLSGFKGHQGPVTSIQGLNLNQFISGSADRCIVGWDIPKQKPFLRYNNIHEKQINELIDFNSNFFACCSSDGYVKLFDSRQDHCIDQIRAHQSEAESMDISETYENGALITAGSDGCIKLWDIRKMELFKQIKASSEELSLIRIFEESNKQILAVLASSEQGLEIVDLISSRFLDFDYVAESAPASDVHYGPINDIFVDSNSHSFYTASSDCNIY